MNTQRYINLPSGRWRYSIGKSSVHIKGPNNQSCCVFIHKLLNCDPNWDPDQVPAVKPSDIKRYIEEELL